MATVARWGFNCISVWPFCSFTACHKKTAVTQKICCHRSVFFLSFWVKVGSNSWGPLWLVTQTSPEMLVEYPNILAVAHLWQMDSLINSHSVGLIWSIHFYNHTCLSGLTQHIWLYIHAMPDDTLWRSFSLCCRFHHTVTVSITATYTFKPEERPTEVPPLLKLFNNLSKPLACGSKTEYSGV